MGKGRGAFTKQIKLNVSTALYHHVAMLAQTRRTALGTTVRGIIEEYFELREALGVQVAHGALAAGGLIPQRLDAMKEQQQRTATHIEEQIVSARLAILTALEESMLSYFAHTAEVPAAAQEQAKKSAVRRLEGWKKGAGLTHAGGQS